MRSREEAPALTAPRPSKTLPAPLPSIRIVVPAERQPASAHARSNPAVAVNPFRVMTWCFGIAAIVPLPAGTVNVHGDLGQENTSAARFRARLYGGLSRVPTRAYQGAQPTEAAAPFQIGSSRSPD